jgi:hypothetical protein
MGIDGGCCPLPQNLFGTWELREEGILKNTSNKSYLKLFYKSEFICGECSRAIHESNLKWLESKFVRTISTPTPRFRRSPKRSHSRTDKCCRKHLSPPVSKYDVPKQGQIFINHLFKYVFYTVLTWDWQFDTSPSQLQDLSHICRQDSFLYCQAILSYWLSRFDRE